MILKKMKLHSFRGVTGSVDMDIHLFNCIVGQNDAGKSTILRALDAALNDKLSRADYNLLATDNQISIELHFDCQNKEILLGEEIPTTFEKEELTNSDGLLVWKKAWEVKDTTLGKSKISLIRKKYIDDYDFLSKMEKDLIKLCTSLGIETSKGNGEAYNNVEKREKLREYNKQNNIEFTSVYEELPSSGTSNIVGNTNKNDITHIIKERDSYIVKQNDEIDYKSIAKDLGIKPDNTFAPLFSTSRMLFLVEGIDDVNAMHHNATLYKQAGLIDKTFDELNINIIPIGGCGGIKHWVNLDLFTKLGKPFFIYLDSDKESANATSLNEQNLLSYGLTIGNDFLISRKRLLENYIAPIALQRLVPNSIIKYSDFDHAKNFCKNYSDSGIRGQLGGAGVADHHYCRLTFEDLRLTWFDGTTDEFIELYNSITTKL
jgi:AAA15 family ATPase/GTPase